MLSKLYLRNIATPYSTRIFARFYIPFTYKFEMSVNGIEIKNNVHGNMITLMRDNVLQFQWKTEGD